LITASSSTITGNEDFAGGIAGISASLASSGARRFQRSSRDHDGAIEASTVIQSINREIFLLIQSESSDSRHLKIPESDA